MRPRRRSPPRAGFLVSLGLAALCSFTGCGSAPPAAAGVFGIHVVAAENVWGSIASQLGGDRVNVTSIVNDPNADPHEYESSTDDARAFAGADLVILNGAGYDDWGQKLLDSNPSSSRVVVKVADILGKNPGDNPHFWYNPAYVEQVASHITSEYTRISQDGSSYFASRHAAFERALGPYHALISDIAARYAGRPVAATEDIFAYLATALHLDLISPPAFMQAVAEGNDPPIQAVAAFTDQIKSKRASVLVYNTQTVTAVTSNIRQLAAAEGIPIVGVSETLQPPSASFQDWQAAQLTALRNALAMSPAR
jgi:zinc/manganese transport system substrate-binding protein